MHTRPRAYTSGGVLPDSPSARNELSSPIRLSTMTVQPLRGRGHQLLESSAGWDGNCNGRGKGPVVLPTGSPPAIDPAPGTADRPWSAAGRTTDRPWSTA